MALVQRIIYLNSKEWEKCHFGEASRGVLITLLSDSRAIYVKKTRGTKPREDLVGENIMLLTGSLDQGVKATEQLWIKSISLDTVMAFLDYSETKPAASVSGKLTFPDNHFVKTLLSQDITFVASLTSAHTADVTVKYKLEQVGVGGIVSALTNFGDKTIIIPTGDTSIDIVIPTVAGLNVTMPDVREQKKVIITLLPGGDYLIGPQTKEEFFVYNF